MIKECRERSKRNDSLGSKFRAKERGAGAKLALVMKSKSQAHKAGKISAIREPRPVCNQQIIITSKPSKHVESVTNLFTIIEQMESIQIEIANGMVVTSSREGSVTTSTDIEWFTLGTVYYIPFSQVNFMSCSRLDEYGVTTSIAKCNCSLYYTNSNSKSLLTVQKK